MKNKIVSLLILIGIILLSSSCIKHESKTKEPTTTQKIQRTYDYISFDRLYDIAVDPSTIKRNNVNFDYGVLDIEANTVSKIGCLGSELAFLDAYGSYEPVLRNVFTNEVVASGFFVPGGAGGNTGSFNERRGIYYSSDAPFIFYETVDENKNRTVTFLDCYGNFLYEMNSKGISLMSRLYSQPKKDFIIYTIEFDKYCLHFKLEEMNGRFNVSHITESEYEEIETKKPGRYVDPYSEYVTTVYDDLGNVTGYFSQFPYSLDVYDSDGLFKNHIDFYECDLNGYSRKIILEKEICYIKGERKLYRIDYETGEMTIETLDYKVSSSNQMGNGDLKYDLVNFYEIDKYGNTYGDIHTSLMKERFSFDEAFIREKFTRNIYKVSDGAVLAEIFDSSIKERYIWHYITENERIQLPGISILEFYDDYTILFQEWESKLYHVVSLEKLLDYLKLMNEGHERIFETRYNSKFVGYDRIDDEKTYYSLSSECDLGNLSTFNRESLEYGIYEAIDGIHIFDDLIFESSQEMHASLSKIDTFGNKVLYKASKSPTEYKYFYVEIKK